MEEIYKVLEYDDVVKLGLLSQSRQDKIAYQYTMSTVLFETDKDPVIIWSCSGESHHYDVPEIVKELNNAYRKGYEDGINNSVHVSKMFEELKNRI